MYSGDEAYGDEVTSPQAGDVRRPEGARGAPRSGGGGAGVLAAVRRERCGFLTAGELAMVAADARTRLTLVLVRCGACRFVVPADQAAHLIGIIEREGTDYVRDVSLPAER